MRVIFLQYKFCCGKNGFWQAAAIRTQFMYPALIYGMNGLIWGFIKICLL